MLSRIFLPNLPKIISAQARIERNFAALRVIDAELGK